MQGGRSPRAAIAGRRAHLAEGLERRKVRDDSGDVQQELLRVEVVLVGVLDLIRREGPFQRSWRF